MRHRPLVLIDGKPAALPPGDDLDACAVPPGAVRIRRQGAPPPADPPAPFFLDRPDWTDLTGSAVLVIGADYWLDAANNRFTTTPPAYGVRLGRAVSPTRLDRNA
jgi:hypothetical protein